MPAINAQRTLRRVGRPRKGKLATAPWGSYKRSSWPSRVTTGMAWERPDSNFSHAVAEFYSGHMKSQADSHFPFFLKGHSHLQ